MNRGQKAAIAAVLGLTALIALAIVVDSGVLLIRGEPVSFQSGAVTLAGTLAIPRWLDGPFPATVIVHGSGRVGWRELRSYAGRLVPHGMAVLMFDKRGTGQSTGVYPVMSMQDSTELLTALADDVLSAVQHLSQRPDIDPNRIGLIGGSQAGWIMPIAASRSNKVAYIVAISGPAVTYGQEAYFSQLTGDDPGPYAGLSDREIRRRMNNFAGPHGFDPIPFLEQLRVPSLWILGGSDRSVPTDLTIANLQAIQLRGSTTFDVELYPRGDHSLWDVRSGRRINYWPRVLNWLREKGMLGP